MISYVYVLNTYGEPCSTSSLCGCTGYTGKYYTWSLLSVLVFYYLWIGVQLPQGEYISYGRSVPLVSTWCGLGYSRLVSEEFNILVFNVFHSPNIINIYYNY